MRLNRLNPQVVTHHNVLLDVAFGPTHNYRPATPRQWRPAADLYETAAHIVIRLEVAGARPGDFRLVLRGRQLTVNGHRPAPPDAHHARAYYQMEVPYGDFRIDLELPVPVDETNAEAEYHNGLLTIQLPKQAPHAPHIR